MACGETVEATELYATICKVIISVPCGIQFCASTLEVTYPCGIRWCKGWFGIHYPCGIRWCHSILTIYYPCGLKWCDLTIRYPCFKSHLVKRYCYDFMHVGGTCYVVVAVTYGCCEGEEYRWVQACLFGAVGDKGVSTGFPNDQTEYLRKCFDKPQTPIGPCRPGYSLPEGSDLPGGPVDPGSVAPHSPPGSMYIEDEGLTFSGIKFGRCSRCAITSAIIAVAGWALFLTLPSLLSTSYLGTTAFGVLATILTLPIFGHFVGLLKQRPR